MIRRLDTGEVIVQRVEECDTFWKRGRGLMFHRSLGKEEALFFVEKRESILGTSIHMLFVFFPIAVIWLDAQKRVVDKKLARPFRLYYAPQRPAQYFLEGHPSLLERVQIGDQLDWANS